jgi:hypothetical protein
LLRITVPLMTDRVVMKTTVLDLFGSRPGTMRRPEPDRGKSDARQKSASRRRQLSAPMTAYRRAP